MMLTNRFHTREKLMRHLVAAVLVMMAIQWGTMKDPLRAEQRPEIGALLLEVVSLQVKNIDARYHFRYQEDEIIEELDADGNPRHFDTKLMEWFHTEYDSYVKYLAINGGQYSPAVLAEQQVKIDHELAATAAKSDGQRQALRAKIVEERDKEKDFIRSLPDAAILKYEGEQTINGQRSWFFSFVPRPGFRPPSRETSFLRTLVGKVWITQDEHQLIRLTGTLQEDVDFGGGLFGSVKKGSTITLEQMPVAEGLWMPAFTEMEFRAKVFVKGQNRIEISRYDHYQPVASPHQKIEVEKLP
jgi:hypothetical protein